MHRKPEPAGRKPNQSADKVCIRSVQFENYKALGRFSLALRHMNMLLGPNNCGKSTVLSAFRILSAGIAIAKAKRPQPATGPRGEKVGYFVPTKDLPLSFENVHTDLAESHTNVVFELSNGAELLLHFPRDGGCLLFCTDAGRSPQSPSEFKQFCPITINHIPVLGPVDHREPHIQEETVKRGLNTHRASTHFRNFWHYNKGVFPNFAKLLRETWPGMEIMPPELEFEPHPVLYMMCTENRLTRELYWAGFGFQVWCQILTHLSRSKDASILVVDEPEIYLHPDLQRQLVHLLRDFGPDIVLATHSSEMVNEAETSEVVLVDKHKPTATRVKSGAKLQEALDVLGSNHNVILTQLAQWAYRLCRGKGFSNIATLRAKAWQTGSCQCPRRDIHAYWRIYGLASHRSDDLGI